MPKNLKYLVKRLYEEPVDINGYPRQNRSQPYQEGVMAALESRAKIKAISNSYTPGSCEYDAFECGLREGHALWFNYLSNRDDDDD
jgi:hypothetical protein